MKIKLLLLSRNKLKCWPYLLFLSDVLRILNQNTQGKIPFDKFSIQKMKTSSTIFGISVNN